jgi:uncharacterized protein (DUF433 family)
MASAAKIVASAQITKDPSVCGGAACIDNTRIRVLDVVQARAEGHTPEQIQDLFALRLSLAQVHLALAYAEQNPAEIEALYTEQERVGAQIERDGAEYLSRRR